MRGWERVNWKLDSDASKNGSYIRCMDDPPCKGTGIDHVNDYQQGMDPHDARDRIYDDNI